MPDKEKINPELAAIRLAENLIGDRRAKDRNTRDREKSAFMKGFSTEARIFLVSMTQLVIEFSMREEVRDLLIGAFEAETEYMWVDVALLKEHRDIYRPLIERHFRAVMGSSASSEEELQALKELGAAYSKLVLHEHSNVDRLGTNVSSHNYLGIFRGLLHFQKTTLVTLDGKCKEEDEELIRREKHNQEITAGLRLSDEELDFICNLGRGSTYKKFQRLIYAASQKDRAALTELHDSYTRGKFLYGVWADKTTAAKIKQILDRLA